MITAIQSECCAVIEFSPVLTEKAKVSIWCISMSSHSQLITEMSAKHRPAELIPDKPIHCFLRSLPRNCIIYASPASCHSWWKYAIHVFFMPCLLCTPHKCSALLQFLVAATMVGLLQPAGKRLFEPIGSCSLIRLLGVVCLWMAEIFWLAGLYGYWKRSRDWNMTAHKIFNSTCRWETKHYEVIQYLRLWLGIDRETIVPGYCSHQMRLKIVQSVGVKIIQIWKNIIKTKTDF